MACASTPMAGRRTGYDLLAFPDLTFADLEPFSSDLAEADPVIREQVARDALYVTYIDRQARDVAAMKRDESHVIPEGFDYAALEGLSNELKMKLSAARPATLAQAGRVEGMTPAAITLILARLRAEERMRAAG